MAEQLTKPGISIIMPCYNTEKYIKKTLSAVFGQSFKNFELIMIDDGSKDSTPEILDKCQADHPDIVRVIHKENEGQSTARNLGLEIAKGDYVVFWDSDDYADTDYLETLYNAALENDSEMVLSGSHYVDERGFIIENLGYPVDEHPNYAGRRLSPHGKMYKIDFLNRHNIRFADGKKYEDNPFNFMAMFLCKRQVILPYCGHYQVIHKGSTMSSVTNPDWIPYEAIENALKYVNEHIDEVNDVSIYEYTVLSYLTYFIFLGNRTHMQAANRKNKGYKNGNALIKDLCDFTQRVIPEQIPNYYKNKYVKIFNGEELPIVQRAGVWWFTRLLKIHMLKPFAVLFYSFVR